MVGAMTAPSRANDEPVTPHTSPATAIGATTPMTGKGTAVTAQRSHDSPTEHENGGGSVQNRRLS
jgi:hypothetical protein